MDDAFGEYDDIEFNITEIIFSRDDGGWYIQQDKKLGGLILSRMTRKIYKSESAAQRELDNGTVKWGKWS